MTELICSVCGTGPFKAPIGLAGHMNKHKQEQKNAEAARVEAPGPAQAPAQGSPAILADWRAYPNPYYGQRSVKMLRPMCKVCQGQENVGIGWWLSCTHDPYVTLSERKEAVPIYEDSKDQPGAKTVVRTEMRVTYVPMPNRVDVALTSKVNGGMGVEMGRGRGFIFPSELRSPHFPFGIANACEYRECWKQTGLQKYGEDEDYVGTFCRRLEARLVWKDQNPNSGALEIGWDDSSRARRRTQLEQARV